MTIDSIGVALSPTSHSPELGTPAAHPGHLLFHPRPQHGCDRCPDVPCPWCDWDEGTCPDAWEHYRLWAGSETSWRRSVA